MKEVTKYIVVVAFPDGTRQEYITLDKNSACIGFAYKGGRIVAVRKLSTKYTDQQV
jgi:hypothetical protein